MSTKRLEEALSLLKTHIDACGPCDHDVNICVCGDEQVLEDARVELEAIRKAARDVRDVDGIRDLWNRDCPDSADVLTAIAKEGDE